MPIGTLLESAEVFQQKDVWRNVYTHSGVLFSHKAQQSDAFFKIDAAGIIKLSEIIQGFTNVACFLVFVDSRVYIDTYSH